MSVTRFVVMLDMPVIIPVMVGALNLSLTKPGTGFSLFSKILTSTPILIRFLSPVCEMYLKRSALFASRSIMGEASAARISTLLSWRSLDNGWAMEGGGLHVFCGLRSDAMDEVWGIRCRALQMVCRDALRRVDREDPMVPAASLTEWAVNIGWLKSVRIALFLKL